MGRRSSRTPIAVEVSEERAGEHRLMTITARVSDEFIRFSDELAKRGAFEPLSELVSSAIFQTVRRYGDMGNEFIARARTAAEAPSGDTSSSS